MSVQITRSPDQPITGSRLRVLYIAYPLLRVTDASAGGAEQVLWTLERELAATQSRLDNHSAPANALLPAARQPR